MPDTIQITDDIVVGPQPSRDDLVELARKGFKSIVNFRTAGEEEQPVSPEDEGKTVQDLGLEYLHIPVSQERMNVEQVDAFRAKFDSLPKPAFLHCKSGKRAGAFTMMHLATKQGKSGDETLQEAEDLGFACDHPALREFVKHYIDEHVGSSAK